MRTFYINTADYNRAPRMAPMVRAVRRRLTPGRPVRYAEVFGIAKDASDLKDTTIRNWFLGAVKAGLLKQTGTYTQLGRVDTRKLALGDWPECPHFCDHGDYDH